MSRNLSNPICPQCDGTGWVRRRAAVGEPAFGNLYPCQCRREYARSVESSNRLRASGLPNRRTPRTFENFIRRQGLEEVCDQAISIAEGIVPPNMLVLNGPVGSGKTHLLEAVGLVSIQLGASVRF